MLISYLQKTTLVDFPGKVACIVFTAGCNFRCGFCHNPESVIPSLIKDNTDNMVSEDYFWEWIEKKRGLLDGVSICGGEPTLQPDLYDFIKKCKKKGFLVKLDTNGRDAVVIEKCLDENLLDYVAVDAKYPISELGVLAGVDIDNDFVDNYVRCLQLLKNSSIDYEYRTTVIQNYHNTDKISQIVSFLGDIPNYYIQNYRSGKTLNPNFDGGSFDEETLLSFQKLAQKTIANVQIRN